MIASTLVLLVMPLWPAIAAALVGRVTHRTLLLALFTPIATLAAVATRVFFRGPPIASRWTQGGDIGGVDVHLGVFLDRGSAAASVVTILIFAAAVSFSEEEPRVVREACLYATAALILVLGDGPFTTGLALTLGQLFSLVASTDRRPATNTPALVARRSLFFCAIWLGLFLAVAGGPVTKAAVPPGLIFALILSLWGVSRDARPLGGRARYARLAVGLFAYHVPFAAFVLRLQLVGVVRFELVMAFLVLVALGLVRASTLERRGVLPRLIAGLVDPFGRSVASIERWVLAPAFGALAGLGELSGHVLVLLERDLVDLPFQAIEKAIVRAKERRGIVGSLAALLVASAILVSPSDAFAAPGGEISVTPGKGSILRLAPGADGRARGEILLTNRGADPLVVSRLSLRGDEDDVRSPPGLTVSSEESLPLIIGPQHVRKVKVEWAPPPGTKAKEAWGHVMITSTDERRGEVAVGFVADPRPFVVRHILSILIFLPLAGAMLAFGSASKRVPCPRWLRWLAMAIPLTNLALVAIATFRFDPTFTRAHGNEGLQLIERAAWIPAIGAEYFVAVDAPSLMFSLIGVLAQVSVGWLWQRDSEVRPLAIGAGLLAFSCAQGTTVAHDVFLFVIFLAGLFLALAVFVTTSPSRSRVFGSAGQSALRLAVFSCLGVGLVMAGLLFLHHASDRTFLADGTFVEKSASMPELARVTFFSRLTPGWGLPVAKTSFVLLVVGFGILGGFFPLHVWLPPIAEETSKPALIVVISSATRVGFLGLLRVAFLILPEACAWAQGTLVALGSVGVLYCALAALAERSLARQLAYAVTAQAGLALASLATLTGPGVGAALVLLLAASASTILAVVVLDLIEVRTGTLDVDSLGSMQGSAPLLGLAFGLTWLGLAGSPGLFAFWGEVLGMMALLAHHATFFAIAALGLVVLASAQLRAVRRVIFGDAAPHVKVGLRRGGDLDGPELLLFPALILLVLLGLSPAPVLAVVQGAVRDAAIFLRVTN